MRALLIAIAFLLIVTTVSAASGDFDGWVLPGEPFHFDGHTYYSFPNNERTSALIETNTSNIIISLGTCQNIGFVQYCLDQIANSTDLEHIKFDTKNNILYGVKLRLTNLGPSLKVTQAYTPGTPDVNQLVQGTITIENTGNQPASYVTLAYALNGSTHIKSCSDCKISGDSFTKTIPQLDAGKSAQVVFTFSVGAPRNFASTANVTFTYQNTTGTQGPFPHAFKIAKPYKATLSGGGKAAVGDWIDLALTLTNTGANPIRIHATPENNASLTYQRTSGLDVTQLSDINLTSGAKATYQYRASAKDAGTYGTGFKITVTRGNETFHENLTKELVYQLEDVRIIAHLAKQNPVSGDSNTLYVQLQDTSKSLSFTNLTLNATGLANGTKTIPSISPGSTIDALTIPITHPKTTRREQGTINVTLTYSTSYGQVQNASETVSYTVLPVNESYEITRTISPKDPAVNQSFTVTVYGTKIADSAVDYTPVSDRIIGATVKHGNTHLVPIESQNKELLYQYDAIRTSERFAIITSVNASFLGQHARINETYTTFNLGELAPASPTAPTTTTSGAENQSANATTGSAPQTTGSPNQASSTPGQKQGIIARIVSWFAHLFG